MSPYPCWSSYVTVNDVDASAQLAAQLGAKVLVPPTDIPKTGRFSVIQDPQGAVFNIISYLS
jgi:predicted enzyme related to lactoylglutathione lyase